MIIVQASYGIVIASSVLVNIKYTIIETVSWYSKICETHLTSLRVDAHSASQTRPPTPSPVQMRATHSCSHTNTVVNAVSLITHMFILRQISSSSGAPHNSCSHTNTAVKAVPLVTQIFTLRQVKLMLRCALRSCMQSKMRKCCMWSYPDIST